MLWRLTLARTSLRSFRLADSFGWLQSTYFLWACDWAKRWRRTSGNVDKSFLHSGTRTKPFLKIGFCSTRIIKNYIRQRSFKSIDGVVLSVAIQLRWGRQAIKLITLLAVHFTKCQKFCQFSLSSWSTMNIWKNESTDAGSKKLITSTQLFASERMTENRFSIDLTELNFARLKSIGTTPHNNGPI